uniref:Uncharacterized protein n=1 Tax=Aegilops tauschii TaxID=37682 RepID=M8CFN9_AEGTA
MEQKQQTCYFSKREMLAGCCLVLLGTIANSLRIFTTFKSSLVLQKQGCTRPAEGFIWFLWSAACLEVSLAQLCLLRRPPLPRWLCAASATTSPFGDARGYSDWNLAEMLDSFKGVEADCLMNLFRLFFLQGDIAARIVCILVLPIGREKKYQIGIRYAGIARMALALSLKFSAVPIVVPVWV